MHSLLLSGLSFLAALTLAHTEPSRLESRDLGGTSHVWLGTNTGEPRFMASGLLLGIPENPDQIPDHWLANIKFWNQRAGGSQLPEPARGWTHGKEEFLVCFAQLSIREE